MTANGPRIGIVGFGSMAEQFHLPKLREAGWDIAAVVDVTPSRSKLARDLGVPIVCRSVTELLECGVDAAVVSTHSSVRREVALPLAHAGVHLLVEKPLATTGDEAEILCRACEESGVLLSVYHNRRWDPDAMIVRSLVESGFLGEIVYLENRSYHHEPATAFGAEDFRQSWRITAELGGGTLLDFGPHWIDQILAIGADGGEVRSVNADVRHLRHGDADDHFTITMRFENGLCAVAAKSDVCRVGPREKWFLVGDRASAVFRDGRAVAQTLEGEERIIDGHPEPPDFHQNFRQAVEGSAELLVRGRESLRTCRIIDAARESAATGRSVDVRI